MMNAVLRQLWSSYSGYLFHAEYLDVNQEANNNFEIVLAPFSEAYWTYYSDLIKIVNKTSLEYLRLKYFRGDPYVAMAISNGIVAHVSFVAKTLSYSEFSILDKQSRAVGPCLTKREFRGKGIYPTILRFLRCSPLGRAGLDIFCRVDNSSSIRGIEKAGFVLKLQYKEKTRFGLAFIQPEKKFS